MSIHLSEKIKLIREAEGLSRPKFSELTGINAGSLKHFESGKIKSIGCEIIQLITKNSQLEKYTMWLMCDKTAPEMGQIAPNNESSKVMGAAIPEATLTSAFEQTMHTSISLGWLTPKEGINFGMLSDVFLADFEKVGGQTLKVDSPEPLPQATHAKI